MSRLVERLKGKLAGHPRRHPRALVFTDVNGSATMAIRDVGWARAIPARPRLTGEVGFYWEVGCRAPDGYSGVDVSAPDGSGQVDVDVGELAERMVAALERCPRFHYESEG